MHIFCGQAFETELRRRCSHRARAITLHVIEELLSRGVEPV